jgi:hypothetical protein
MRFDLATLLAVLLFFQLSGSQYGLHGDPLDAFKPIDPGWKIAGNGLSPDGKVAIITYKFQTLSNGEIAGDYDHLISRENPGKFLWLKDTVLGTSSSSQRAGGFSATVRWASDSSAVLFFKNNPNFWGGAYDIYVVPIIKGKPGKITNLEAEICKIPHDDFVKSHAEPINDSAHIDYEIMDGKQPKDLTFNASNQIVIDCFCTNNPNHELNAAGQLKVKVWTSHVTAIWDPLQSKFIKASSTRVE